MHSSFIKSCLLALATASSVFAQTTGFDVFTQPSSSSPGSSIPAGSTYTIKWTPSSPAGQVSIILLQGPSNTTLQTGPTIASKIESVTGSYDWAVPSDLQVFPFYGFKLQLDSDPNTFQFSTYFTITGLAASGSSGSSSAVSTTTVASTSVTVQVSQVGPITSSSTTTVSASLTTVNTTSTASSTPSGIFPNSTMITTTSKVATSAPSTTSTSASASSSSGAGGSVVVGGTGLIGALFIGLGMLL